MMMIVIIILYRLVLLSFHCYWLRDPNSVRRMSSEKNDYYITEVDIRVQPMDCVLSPVTLEPFSKVYEPWLHLKIPKPSISGFHRAPSFKKPTSVTFEQPLSRDHSMSPTPPLITDAPKAVADTTDPPPDLLGLSLNNQVLPLLYLHMEGMRIFLPTKSSPFDKQWDKILPLPEGGGGGFGEHDMVLLQVSSVLISPQVDNTIERTIERKDIWKLAQQAGVLSLPGSVLEDREYQLDILGVSLTSGQWQSVISPDCVGRKPRTNSQDKLRLMGENPALEWNNYDPHTSTKDPALPVLHPIVCKFDTRITFAPAIVYTGDWIKSGLGKGKKGKPPPAPTTTTIPSSSSVTTSHRAKVAINASGEATKSTSENSPAVIKLKNVSEEVGMLYVKKE